MRRTIPFGSGPHAAAACFALAIAVQSVPAGAELPMVGRAPSPANRIGALAGWENVPVIAFAYARGWSELVGRHPGQIDVTLTLALALLTSFDGFKLAVGAAMLFTANSGWGVGLSGRTSLALARDTLGTHLGWGLVREGAQPDVLAE